MFIKLLVGHFGAAPFNMPRNVDFIYYRNKLLSPKVARVAVRRDAGDAEETGRGLATRSTILELLAFSHPRPMSTLKLSL